MKKRALIYLILFNTLLLNSCKDEVDKEITFEEQILTRVKTDCNFYQNFRLQDIERIVEFENSEFTVSPWINSIGPDSFGLFLKFYEGDSIHETFAASVGQCGLQNFTFELNEKYRISGHGVILGSGPNSENIESSGGRLLIDNIEKIE